MTIYGFSMIFSSPLEIQNMEWLMEWFMEHDTPKTTTNNNLSKRDCKV